MQVECPSCGFALEYSADSVAIDCPACGSNVSGNDETLVLREDGSNSNPDPEVPATVPPIAKAKPVHEDSDTRKVQCPECGSTVAVAGDTKVGEIACPSCGSVLGDPDRTQALVRRPKELAHYELVEMVGRGYFGEVWKARDTKLNRNVAIKLPRTQVYSNDSRVSFLREARATAKLRHENIVTVYDVHEEEDGTIYIVSDFVDGVTLSALVREQGISIDQAADVCATIADGLHYAHQAGVVHRDVKPNNVMVDNDGKPYIMDFGLAKHDTGEETITATGEVLGTPAYMPPEQARGDSREADGRSDVYSLGVILYQLLSGRRPFGGSSRMLIRQILLEEPKPPRKFRKDLPRDLETICLKAMAKEAEKRYQTAGEMADDLRRYRRGEPINARPVGQVERVARWARRNPAISAAYAVTAAAVLLLTGFVLRDAGTPVEASQSPRGSAPPVTVRTVHVHTDPPGATVVAYQLDPQTGEATFDDVARPKERTPLTLSLAAGHYLFVVVSDDPRYSFHEVLRRVPAAETINEPAHAHTRWTETEDGEIILPMIRIPTDDVVDGMAKFAGSEDFELLQPAPEPPPGEVGSPIVHSHKVRVAGFYLDPQETTAGEYADVIGDNAKPFLAYRRAHKIPIPDPSFPIGCTCWDDAVWYAERVGKRLPSEAEYVFAATNGGTQTFPWGEEPPDERVWRISRAGEPTWDKLETDGNPPVFGLLSNVAEWTASWSNPLGSIGYQDRFGKRILRGGVLDHHDNLTTEPWRAIEIEGTGGHTRVSGPRVRSHVLAEAYLVAIGFRCARSVKPRRTKEDFELRVE